MRGCGQVQASEMAIPRRASERPGQRAGAFQVAPAARWSGGPRLGGEGAAPCRMRRYRARGKVAPEHRACLLLRQNGKLRVFISATQAGPRPARTKTAVRQRWLF